MGSGFKTFTAASVLTAADLNNFCQSQSVMYFATTAARDTAITSPVAGMVAYVGSNDSSEGLYTYNGTAWRRGPGWNAPWGVMGLHKLTAAAATTGTHTTSQINNLTTTFNAVSNRQYKLTMVSHPYASGGANNYQCYIYVNGAIAAGSQYMTLNTGFQTTVTTTGYFTTTSSASMTVAGYHNAFGANTQVTDSGNSTFVRVLMVEDIGPSGAPV
jgi:hypothetical protein